MRRCLLRRVVPSQQRVIPWNRKCPCLKQDQRMFCFSAPAIRRVRSWPRPSSTGRRRKIPRLFGRSQPKGQVHPYALDLLRKLNFDVPPTCAPRAGTSSPSPTRRASISCSRCATTPREESCPVWPGKPMRAHWGIPDPAAATGNEAEVRLAFADAFRMLNQRITIFVDLPHGIA